MSDFDIQPSSQIPEEGVRAGVIFVYTAMVALATQLVALPLGLPLLPIPSGGICIAGLLIGLFLNRWEAPQGEPPPPFVSFLLLLAICGIIGGAFWYAHLSPNGRVAIAFAFGAALAWALSVVGSLLWRLASWIMAPRWNAWFNFFAAGFAALAAGYTPPS
jgi:hypothetical protein